jgi:hypothetical protein
MTNDILTVIGDQPRRYYAERIDVTRSDEHQIHTESSETDDLETARSYITDGGIIFEQYVVHWRKISRGGIEWEFTSSMLEEN